MTNVHRWCGYCGGYGHTSASCPFKPWITELLARETA